MIRVQPVDYGFELNEFDPFFNYRATQFIVDNGIPAYLDWHDDRSWHPEGRDISKTSQEMLHITASSLYSIFGGGSSLKDFTIMFPVVIGSLTTIIIFALVRVIGGTTAGLFAALFFSVSASILIRGMIGWFKSEPLGLFYGILGLYLFLSGIKADKKKISLAKMIGGGVFLGFGSASWGGIDFFVIPLGLFFFALPFFRKDHEFLVWAIPVFVISFLITVISFERPGLDFVTSMRGWVLIVPTIFLVLNILIQKISKPEKIIRNGLIVLGLIILASISFLAFNSTLESEDQIIPIPRDRYLTAINPFHITTDPLYESIAEQAITTISQSFFFSSILMIFAGIGVWLIISNKEKLHNSTLQIKNDMIVFVLIFGLTGVYVGSTFVRLELFASLSVIILASIGISILTSEIFKKSMKHEGENIVESKKTLIKIFYVVGIIVLLIIPTVLPVDGSWIKAVNIPPTILNGGTYYDVSVQDFPEAMLWLKNNTPEDSVIAAWWDYGYWITVLGERITLADNATLSTDKIVKIASMFISPPDRAMELLSELDADYVLVFVAGQKILSEPDELYVLSGGGDESKMPWFMRIADLPVEKYIHSDGITGNPEFWGNTLLGKMIPFTPIGYVDPTFTIQSQFYQPGFEAIYSKNVKYPLDGDGPLKLVYSSKSFDREDFGVIIGVFIYEINKDYPSSIEPAQFSQNQNEVSIIETKFGEITIQFKENVAPKTVQNFKKLANSGFYDGTIFHRIVPGFVIQGGDPNTISEDRATWGIGGPEYSIEPEFSNLKHQKYIVSMARGIDVNSAGSQFFIMLDDAPWLDGQYTIFGEVISGHEVVEKIAALETNELDQPINPEDAEISQIIIST